MWLATGLGHASAFQWSLGGLWVFLNPSGGLFSPQHEKRPPEFSGGRFYLGNDGLNGRPGASPPRAGPDQAARWESTARSRSATMLVILIIGFTAGPAVSL